MSTVATIVCPVDFSDHSKVALARAGAWAQHFGARLIVLTVVEPVLASAAATAYDMDLVRDEVLPENAMLRDRCFDRAKESLGESLFQAALSEGRAMTLREAIQYALEDKP